MSMGRERECGSITTINWGWTFVGLRVWDNLSILNVYVFIWRDSVWPSYRKQLIFDSLIQFRTWMNSVVKQEVGETGMKNDGDKFFGCWLLLTEMFASTSGLCRKYHLNNSIYILNQYSSFRPFNLILDIETTYIKSLTFSQIVYIHFISMDKRRSEWRW